jgi:hypothetical protein
VQTIVKKQFVRIDGEPAGALPRQDRKPSKERCAKTVRLLQQDGVARALEVTCSCGETTLIELEYPTS